MFFQRKKFRFSDSYDVIMSFTVVVVTFGPFSESLMSRRKTDKFCVNLKIEEKQCFKMNFAPYNQKLSFW